MASVESNGLDFDAKKAPYPGKYIAESIAAIPAEDIRESKEGGYPTVFVIGDRP
jgi:hypothetical protein